MNKISTGYYDINDNEIYVNSILFNDFMQDKWNVEYRNSKWIACLIPNSGIAYHSHPVYPMHTELLEDVCESFRVII